MESASTDIYSRFDAVGILPHPSLPAQQLGTLTGSSFSSRKGTISPGALALLLRDAAAFLRPSPLVSEDGDEFVPGALRALSDLHALFDSKPRDPRVAAKVVFYAARVRRAPASLLRALGADAGRWAAKLDEEEQDQDQGEGGNAKRAGEEVVGTRRELGETRRLGPESLNAQGRETHLIVELP